MRVVLVEPSTVGLECVSRLLVSAGCSVLPFKDSRLALEHLVSDPNIDVLITSFEFPTMSGLRLCSAARQISKEKNRQLYILMMSSDRDQAKLLDALENGADDFISKPPNSQELTARLKSAERMKSAQSDLIRLAKLDPLTELYNRRAFFELGDQICSSASSERPVTAMMFDIDHFKQVNDTYGHDAGDKVIKLVAKAATSLPGISGRLGGEEFASIFFAGEEIAMELAEQVRTEVMEHNIQLESSIEGSGTQLLAVTVSIGVAVSRVASEMNWILKQADTALYRAKLSGRNRVVLVVT